MRQELAQMKTAAEVEVPGAPNMTTNLCVEFQVRLYNAATKATTCSISDTDRIGNHQERDIYGMTLNEQMHFK
jgi:hypothetical protein